MNNFPTVPMYKPDPALVAAIRAAIARIKLNDLQRRAVVARTVS